MVLGVPLLMKVFILKPERSNTNKSFFPSRSKSISETWMWLKPPTQGLAYWLFNWLKTWTESFLLKYSWADKEFKKIELKKSKLILKKHIVITAKYTPKYTEFIGVKASQKLIKLYIVKYLLKFYICRLINLRIHIH